MKAKGGACALSAASAPAAHMSAAAPIAPAKVFESIIIPPRKRYSEVGSVGPRDRCVGVGIIFEGILGAAHFPQLAFGALIGDERLPGHGEHVRIFDGQLDLQSFADISLVEDDAVRVRARTRAILRVESCRG